MDHSRELNSLQLATQNRSIILTPCRRIGLSRKSRFSVPLSPAPGGINEVLPFSGDETSCNFKTTPVKGESDGSRYITAVTTCGNVERRKRRMGRTRCKFKSPSRSTSGTEDFTTYSESTNKLELTLASKNLAATAFSNSPIASQSRPSINTKPILESFEDCERLENRIILMKKRKIDNDHKYYPETQSEPLTSITNCIDQLIPVENVSSSGSISEITDEVMNAAVNRVKEKEDVFCNLELKYQRKQGLIAELQEVTGQWLAGGQVAATDLLSRCRDMGDSVMMAQLLSRLGIPAPLLRYNSDDEEFLL